MGYDWLKLFECVSILFIFFKLEFHFFLSCKAENAFMQSDLNLQASELTVNECTLYIVYAFPENQPMTLMLLAHVLAAMQ